MGLGGMPWRSSMKCHGDVLWKILWQLHEMSWIMELGISFCCRKFILCVLKTRSPVMMMILSRCGFSNNPQQGVLPPLSLREQAEDNTQDGGVRVSRMPEARSPHSERASVRYAQYKAGPMYLSSPGSLVENDLSAEFDRVLHDERGAECETREPNSSVWSRNTSMAGSGFVSLISRSLSRLGRFSRALLKVLWRENRHWINEKRKKQPRSSFSRIAAEQIQQARRHRGRAGQLRPP